ncbi:MAG TPA: DUF6152 family protein [Terriglobia bacterium]|nr:DUF6152 family protein [Terriglobia bacterium]
MKATIAALVLLGLVAVAVPAIAHHAFAAEFDSSKPIQLKGKFTKMDWINPHSWMWFDVTYPDGKVVNWGAECLPPNGLYRNGWRKDTLKPGEEVEVQGFAAKDGSTRMWASRVSWVSQGGQQIFGLNQRRPE